MTQRQGVDRQTAQPAGMPPARPYLPSQCRLGLPPRQAPGQASRHAPGQHVLALLGDTMLGRGVAERIREAGPRSVVAADVREIVASADAAVLNLECCISTRGEAWPGKRFHFRAPPAATETLSWLGVDCVTLANNHALDYGPVALADTTAALRRAGIAWAGAGADDRQARTPAVVDLGGPGARGLTVAVVGVTDHPEDFAAGRGRPGVAHAELYHGLPDWLTDTVRQARERADLVLVSPHWGPNLTTSPPGYVRRAADAPIAAGVSLVAGHSAHVLHGAAGRVLFDLGEFVDDYAVDPVRRNDLGMLALVAVDADGPVALSGVPLALDAGQTHLATGADRQWVLGRFVEASRRLGARATHDGERAHLPLR